MVNVFLSVAGQNDNLGDSVLRRGFLRSFQGTSVGETHVLVGNNDDDYLSAVGLTGSERLHRSSDSWSKALDRSVLRTRTVIGFNAGEVQVTAERAHLGWRTLGRLLLAGTRGGAGIHVGVGIRDPRKGSTAALKAVLRQCAVVSWRDEPSREATGTGLITPDWAFSEGSTAGDRHSRERNRVVVSMRVDRPAPTAEWIGHVRRAADSSGCSITVFSQVHRDNERAVELAARFGADAEIVVWESGSHAEWENTARELYSRARFVVSDRLHALIIGATEGAVPIGFTVPEPEKLRRTLGAAGLGEFAFALDSSDDVSERLDTLIRSAGEVDTAVSAARVQISSLQQQIAARLR